MVDINNPNQDVLGKNLTDDTLKEKKGFMHKVGDAIEKVGDVVERKVSKNLGEKIENFGDKVEHSRDQKH